MVEYKRYMEEQEDVATVQMDTVAGRKGVRVLLNPALQELPTRVEVPA